MWISVNYDKSIKYISGMVYGVLKLGRKAAVSVNTLIKIVSIEWKKVDDRGK